MFRENSVPLHIFALGAAAPRTPRGPAEWSVTATRTGPSLWPSVGNWQKPCQSHDIISRGGVEWATRWAPVQIVAGRCREEERRREYYDALQGIISRSSSESCKPGPVRTHRRDRRQFPHILAYPPAEGSRVEPVICAVGRLMCCTPRLLFVVDGSRRRMAGLPVAWPRC
ncbi:DUF6527 family protein [Bradyrhizobium sp. B097]|uniref:DUF6527 family protein n=1 Tax=Bradyrhizobium sp. B097 TaxID=3140244 RepID=UPI003183A7E6